VIETEPCQKSYIAIEKIKSLKLSLLQKIDSFGKNLAAKNLGKVLRILQNIIEKSFISWQVLPLAKIFTPISDTPCIFFAQSILRISIDTATTD
jgi:hypothetical protein